MTQRQRREYYGRTRRAALDAAARPENSNSAGIINTLRGAGLEPRLGYKLKDQAVRDVALWRWTGRGWRDSLAVGPLVEEAAALNALEAGAVAGHHVVVWACCCRDCLTPDVRQWTMDYCARTGISVSHGYAPECFEREQARLLEELKP